MTKKDYDINPKLCKQCNCVIVFEKRENKFCTSKCSAIINNKTRIRKTKKIRLCECGSQTSSRCAKYCKHCIEKGKHLHIAKNFNSIKSESARRRWLLRESKTPECSLCGINTWQGKPTPVVMDHIDGNPNNNCRENLRLICSNCDAQLPTYKGKNKGNGRHSRAQRYKNGQSY